MKILVFLALFFAGMYFVPDAWVADVVKSHIPTSGDGEEAMDSFEMTVIVIKTVVCGLGAYLLMTLLWWQRHPQKK